MKPDLSWVTFRELDTAAALPKGSAFVCFKRRLGDLVEGIDFVVLDHQRDAGLAARLHAENRIYRSSIHPVLLHPDVASRIRSDLTSRVIHHGN